MLALSADKKELAVVDDQQGAPTFARDLAWALKRLLEKGTRGIIHCTNSGSCSWFQLCSYVFDKKGIQDVKLVPVSTDRFTRPAKRPLFSVLDNRLLEQAIGQVMRPWQDAVSEYISVLSRAIALAKAS